MGFQLNRILNTDLGRIIISILLGLGLSTIFKKSCSGQSCITHHGPILGQIDGKTYQYGDKCYQYTISPIQCDPKKKSVEFSNEMDDPMANMAAPEPAKPASWFNFGASITPSTTPPSSSNNK